MNIYLRAAVVQPFHEIYVEALACFLEKIAEKRAMLRDK